jgi:glucose/arabinose dehydrogenase
MLLLAAALLCAGPRAFGQAALTTEVVASGLSRPVFVTAPPGDSARIFIIEQRAGNTGRIRIVENGVLLATPFLTVGPLSTGSEQGLLGMAFAPDYETSGTFYIHYTDLGGTTRLARRTVSASDPNVADTTNTVLLSVSQPFGNHNGGWIAFGDDGYLYMSLGDGGSFGDPGDRAQDLDSLLGKLLRLDVTGHTTYAIPADNPYAGIAGRDEIWSLGLRNMWRGSFDRATGDLYLADVGQNIWEEINVSPAAAGAGRMVNYGWRCWEANAPYTTSNVAAPCSDCDDLACFAFPVYDYNHTDGRCSVTGGYVYRGNTIPFLQGTYFFADYCTGEVFSFRWENGSIAGFQDRTAELAPAGSTNLGLVASFGEDAAGEIYICDLGGVVYRIAAADAGGVDDTTPPATGLTLRGASPFRDRLRLTLSLPETGPVRIDVFDLAGRRVRQLSSGTLDSGEHGVTWDGRDETGAAVRSGVYLVRAVTPAERTMMKTVLLR